MSFESMCASHATIMNQEHSALIKADSFGFQECIISRTHIACMVTIGIGHQNIQYQYPNQLLLALADLN